MPDSRYSKKINVGNIFPIILQVTKHWKVERRSENVFFPHLEEKNIYNSNPKIMHNPTKEK